MNSPPYDAVSDFVTTQDTLFGGRLQLRQPAKGHRAGTDAVLLAATAPRVAGHVIDVGAGVGSVGLAVALRNPEARVCLLERDLQVAALARDNVVANALCDRVSVTETDVLATLVRRNAGMRNESADLVLTNPPFYENDRGQVPRDALKRSAYVIEGDLGGWLRACLSLLRPGGTICLIHRAEAVAAVLSGLGRGVGNIRLRPVHPRAGQSATRILVTGAKGSRAPLTLLPPLVLHDTEDVFTDEAASLHAGDWLQPD